ncbi:MAG TPA: hypothetical protein DCE56_10445 [Cyanobacteria bacterium UBA8553]|nr:hypothetical protein [Cyanobacteria bacterium UBA8553]HAJ61533.1 hypothetical protein [Cyanobacteria bacterium UBA8543]
MRKYALLLKFNKFRILSPLPIKRLSHQVNKVTIKIKLFISSIGKEPRVVKTTERIPVSELKQFKM